MINQPPIINFISWYLLLLNDFGTIPLTLITLVRRRNSELDHDNTKYFKPSNELNGQSSTNNDAKYSTMPAFGFDANPSKLSNVLYNKLDLIIKPSVAHWIKLSTDFNLDKMISKSFVSEIVESMIKLIIYHHDDIIDQVYHMKQQTSSEIQIQPATETKILSSSATTLAAKLSKYLPLQASEFLTLDSVLTITNGDNTNLNYDDCKLLDPSDLLVTIPQYCKFVQTPSQSETTNQTLFRMKHPNFMTNKLLHVLGTINQRPRHRFLFPTQASLLTRVNAAQTGINLLSKLRIDPEISDHEDIMSRHSAAKATLSPVFNHLGLMTISFNNQFENVYLTKGSNVDPYEYYDPE